MTFCILRACLAATLLAFAAPAIAQLKPVEQRMVQVVDAEQERTIAMLGKWVNQNSGTMNFPGVKAVGQMLRAELEPLGFKVEWIDISAANRSGHIVARRKGRGKRLLLIAHLDTVFEPDSPFQRWERRGDKGIGPGSGDDKGGMAVIVAALRAMHQAGTLRNADITVFLTGDEEDAGSPLEVSRKHLVAEGKRADVALDFEGLSREQGRDIGSIARRSSDEWTVTVTSATGHSSGIFGSRGYGAVYELARIIDSFRRELPEPNLTYNVGLVGGGAEAQMSDDKIKITASGKTNIVAGAAFARGDLRALSLDQIARTKAKMAAIVARPLPGAKASIEFHPGGYPPMAPTEGNRALLARLNAVNRDMGLEQMGELDPAKRGAGDISFVANDVDGLVGLGPAGESSHAPGESVDIPSIFLQAKRAAILMTRLARERRP